ncbi:MAG TPA: hypothetical protein V6C69_05565 [Trichormus sp.]|jgi:hypothetical protein
MDKLLLSTKKRVLVPVIFIGAFVLWLFLCKANYDSYWNGTIYRVQTTDFNLLHHILPQTISELIISGRDDLVENVLDSTYGLFGVVITDPSGQSILYQTSKTYLNRESWQDKAIPEALAEEAKREPPDLLTDPPPLEPIWEHKSPRDAGPPHRSSFINAANIRGRRVLGYLYYIRPQPPSFAKDMTTWLGTGVWELSGAKRGYFYITLCTIALSLVILLLVWLRQRVLETKKLELAQLNRELEIRKKALEHLSAELTAQKQRKVWLEKEAEESYRRASSLKQALIRLRESLTIVNAQPGFLAGHGNDQVKVRPAVHPPSALLEEIEHLIPALADNADALKSQASLLHDYCSVLEQRQAEMKRIVEHAYARTQTQAAAANFIDMSPN